jgi:transposase-like protein
MEGVPMEKLAEPRRRYGYYEKRAILEEHINLGLSLSILSRKYQIHPVTLYSWKRMLTVSEDTPQKPNIEEILAENERLKKENKHLKKSVANLSIDKSILTDAVEILKKKSQERALLQQQKKS